jgi:hypothetical protein
MNKQNAATIGKYFFGAHCLLMHRIILHQLAMGNKQQKKHE